LNKGHFHETDFWKCPLVNLDNHRLGNALRMTSQLQPKVFFLEQFLPDDVF